MRSVTVSTTFWRKGETDTGYLIETVNDLITYMEHQSNVLLDDFRYAIKKKIPKSRWDHFYGSPLSLGTNIAKIKGKSPIIEACQLLDIKQSGMMKTLLDFGAIFVNSNGGYHNFSYETHTILKENDVFLGRKKIIKFAENPSLLNLENDPMLEDYTERFFLKNNLEISYLCNLRNFSYSDLVSTFTDFKSKGGSGLYVYTTGMDIEQMEDYCKAAIESKLESIKIDFNVSFSKEHKEMLDSLSNQINLNYDMI